ncbi:hypothetical protein [Qipengyuania gaetbuli]|uniref:hypothetical protein n=1 Tax=Qipengyuania gaetbuli TaxID=266952 RepID=UPI001CD60DA1|nr:hypothetical protein [Qipengyuania gaetbuli]MCA0911018.1 hypothetical protein [Qipengyuania gaetbuli]
MEERENSDCAEKGKRAPDSKGTAARDEKDAKRHDERRNASQDWQAGDVVARSASGKKHECEKACKKDQGAAFGAGCIG